MADFANVPAPMQYAQKENLGTLLANAAGTAFQGYQAGKANEEAQASKAETAAFQQQFGKAYAAGDVNAMQQLAADHPQHWEQVQKGMAVVNENNKTAVGNASSQISLAMQTGNQKTIAAALQRNAPALQTMGISADDVAAQYQQDPNKAQQMVDMIGLHTLGPAEYHKQQQADLKQAQDYGLAVRKADQQDRSLDQGDQQIAISRQNAGTAAYNAQTSRMDTNLRAQANQFDMGLKAQQLEVAKNGQSAKAQDNQIKLYQQAQSIVDQHTQATQALAPALQTLSDFRDMNNANPATLGHITGMGGKAISAIPGTSGHDMRNLLENMQAQARSVQMSSMRGLGSVSDAEGAAAQKAVLNLDQSSSKEKILKAVQNWSKYLESKQTALDSQNTTVQNAAQYMQNNPLFTNTGGANNAPAQQSQPAQGGGSYTSSNGVKFTVGG